MMGTLGRVLAEKGITTPKERYWADVEGDIENVNDVLRITQIRVKYNLEVDRGKGSAAEEALSSYLTRCPGAQSVVGCIDIRSDAVIEEL